MKTNTKSFYRIILKIVAIIALTSFSAASQTKQDFSDTYYNIFALLLLFVLILIVFGFLYFGMGERVSAAKKKKSLLKSLRQLLTRSTPIEREADIMLDHDYDGIKELDNRIPPWFSGLFYLTIIFAIYYMIDYHVLETSKLQAEEYEEEMRIADMQRTELIKSGALINEDTVEPLTDDESINNGKEIYRKNCIACHGELGGGLIGPNLTDEYWIHGGGIKNIFKVIKYGVPAKGMISWQQQLNPKQIQEVSSFIISIEGSNPLNAKQPEGDKYVQQ